MYNLINCSFVPRLIFKNYFLFLFIVVAFIVNGFFISKIYAEEVVGEITVDTHWVVEGSPYILNEYIYVAPDVTLTIDPGVVVKSLYGGLAIDGKLEALGTEEAPIYFTSFYDDTVGGDTDGVENYCYYNTDEEGNNIGDEICETYEYEPEMEDWNSIIIMSDGVKSTLNNVISKYSKDGLLVTDGASVLSVNFNSDKGIALYGSKGNSFTGLNIPDIEISSDSSANITDANITSEDIGQSSSSVSIYGNSSLVMNNSVVNSNTSSIILYNNSSLVASDLSLDCGGDGIYLYSNSSLILSDTDIKCGVRGIYVHSDSTADISDVKVSGASEAGIMVHGNSGEDAVKITKSEITENENGFIFFRSDIVANQNSIHDNNTSGLTTYDSEQFTLFNYDFRNNFWGSASGPTHSLLASNLPGDILDFDNILYQPFLPTDPLKVQVRNPVILIPGITATYLNRDYGDKSEIWPDVGRLLFSPDDSFLNDLVLNIDGTQNPEYPIVPGDIIRKMVTVHVFDRLIEELTNVGYIEGTDLFVFPYDWRLSTESTAVLLKDKIDEILSDTNQEKVDIVAHSMGGLVVKKYIKDNGEEKIDQLIFLGTPQLGAPKAFKVLMYGDNMGYKFLFMNLNKIRSKFMSQNMPSAYELLPSSKYIENNGNYIINALNEIIIPGSSLSLDYSGTKDFLIEKGRNPLMFPFAENLHNSIDDLDLSGIRSYNFAGCGFKTIGGVTVKQKRSWKGFFLGLKDDYDLKYVNGDETVPLTSSTKTIGSEIKYVQNVTHGELPSADGVKENILAILNGGEPIDSSNIIEDVSTCNISGDVVSTHSPVVLHIYDEEGNHVGPDENGDIEYGIPGVQYDVLDEVNYSFLPSGINYKIITNATDTGGYNFKIESEDKDDTITNTYKWNLIPLATLDTTGEIWIGPDYSPAEYNVKIDNDGDGVIDENYTEGFDGTEIAEKATKKKEKTRNSHIVGFIPKKEKNENWGGHNFIDNIKIPKEENILHGSGKSKEVNSKSIVKSDSEKIEDKGMIKDGLMASAGSLDFKMNKGSLFVIIGGSILVLLLAIKFIIKVK